MTVSALGSTITRLTLDGFRESAGNEVSHVATGSQRIQYAYLTKFHVAIYAPYISIHVFEDIEYDFRDCRAKSSRELPVTRVPADP